MSTNNIFTRLTKNASAVSKLFLSTISNNGDESKQEPTHTPQSSSGNYLSGLYFRYTPSEITSLNPEIDFFEPQKDGSGFMGTLKNISMSSAEKLFYEGCRYLLFGFEKKAIDSFYRALEKEPQLSDAYFMLGILDRGPERRMSSGDSFQKALILNTNLGKTLKKTLPSFRVLIPVTNHLSFVCYSDFIGVNILHALALRKNPVESCKIMRRTLDLVPRNGMLLFFYSLFLFERGRRDRIVSILKGVMPNTSAFELNYLLLGKVLYDGGDFNAALEVLNKAYSTNIPDPQLNEDYLNLIHKTEAALSGRAPANSTVELLKRLAISLPDSPIYAKSKKRSKLLKGDNGEVASLYRQDIATSIPISSDSIIGSCKDADIKYDSDSMVSERHALISVESSHLYIEDLGSATGTFVNGFKISKKLPLNIGDKITVGNEELLVQ